MAYPPLDRRPVETGRTVYRFVHTGNTHAPELRIDFLSDKARFEYRGEDYAPVDREATVPELQNGMSVFSSPAPMRERWARISRRAAQTGKPVKIGDYIAEVVLEPGQEFYLEDLEEEDGHLTLWGDPDRLMQAVGGIEPAAS